MAKKRTTPKKKTNGLPKNLALVSALLVALVAGAAGYYISKNNFSNAETAGSCGTFVSGLTPLPRNEHAAVFKDEYMTHARADRLYAVQLGGDYARFQVCPGDNYYATDGRQRAELVEYPPHKKRIHGQEIWARFQVKITGYPIPSKNGNAIVHQIYQGRSEADEATNAPKPPMMSIGFSANSANKNYCLCIYARGDTHDPTSNATRSGVTVYSEPYDPNKTGTSWITFKYHAVTGQGNGVLEVWKNGTKIVNKHGTSKNPFVFGYVPLLQRPTVPNLQFGIYRSGEDSPFVVEYRQLRVSDQPF